MIWFWTVICVFILLLIILFVPFRVLAEYNEKLFLKVKVGFISFKINSKGRKDDNKTKKKSKYFGKFKGFFKNKNMVHSAKEFKSFFAAAGKTAKYFFKKISVRKFDLSVKVGAPDAAVAALRYGQVSSAVYPLCSAVNSFANPKSYQVMVLPDFMSEKITITFKIDCVANLMCIFCVMIKFLKDFKIENKK